MRNQATITLLVSLTILAACGEAPGPSAAFQSPGNATTKSSAEFQNAFQALRNLEAQVQSGVEYTDYSRAVGELAAAYAAFEESPEAGKNAAFQRGLYESLAGYQRAKDLWRACVNTPRHCGYGFVPVRSTSGHEASTAARAVLERFPELNKARVDGGVLSNDSSEGAGMNQARTDELLEAEWRAAVSQGKALRASVR